VNKLDILIGGDLVPTKSNFELFCSANTSELLGNALLDIIIKADFRVFNLEVPLTDQEMPIIKCGPNLIAPTSTINGIKQFQTDLLTLANNHIMDQGTQGLDSTIKVLSENGINYVGAGTTLKEAACPYVFKRNGLLFCRIILIFPLSLLFFIYLIPIKIPINIDNIAIKFNNKDKVNISLENVQPNTATYNMLKSSIFAK
jgi:hypothetical protein